MGREIGSRTGKGCMFSETSEGCFLRLSLSQRAFAVYFKTCSDGSPHHILHCYSDNASVLYRSNFLAVICINLLQNEPIFIAELHRETQRINKSLLITQEQITFSECLCYIQMVSLNMKEWFSPPYAFFFYNTLLYYNLLNIHLLPFRLKLLKFKYRAIFITEEYVKQ